MIARAIAAHLRHAGLDVVLAEDGDKGLRKLRYEQHDVAVVDLMLPGVDGWALTQEARREGITTPILIVSARSSEHDKVHALEIGADDYLAKPFGMRELVARVQALLRRTRAGEPGESLDADRRSGAADRSRRAAGLPARRGRRAGSTPSSRRPSSGCCSRSRASPAGCSTATSCSSASGTSPTARATARSTCACASCARSSTGAPRTPTSRRSTASATASIPRRRPRPSERRYPRDMATVTAAPLRIEDAAGIRTLVLNRPERRNALSLALLRDLLAALAETAADTSVHAVDRARRGAGVLRGPRPLRDDRLLAADRARAVRHLQRADDGDPPPAAARDRAGARHRHRSRAASSSPPAISRSRARMPASRRPACASACSARRRWSRSRAPSGRKRALEMLLTGELIDAPTAADWGLVNRVVPRERLGAGRRSSSPAASRARARTRSRSARWRSTSSSTAPCPRRTSTRARSWRPTPSPPTPARASTRS